MCECVAEMWKERGVYVVELHGEQKLYCTCVCSSCVVWLDGASKTDTFDRLRRVVILLLQC